MSQKQEDTEAVVSQRNPMLQLPAALSWINEELGRDATSNLEGHWPEFLNAFEAMGLEENLDLINLQKNYTPPVGAASNFTSVRMGKLFVKATKLQEQQDALSPMLPIEGVLTHVPHQWLPSDWSATQLKTIGEGMVHNFAKDLCFSLQISEQ